MATLTAARAVTPPHAYPDLHDQAGRLVVVDRPINKDTETRTLDKG